jgi:hypothetical protein
VGRQVDWSRVPSLGDPPIGVTAAIPGTDGSVAVVAGNGSQPPGDSPPGAEAVGSGVAQSASLLTPQEREELMEHEARIAGMAMDQ